MEDMAPKIKELKYTEDSILEMTSFEAIRARPGGYIADKSVSGLAHCISEIYDNANDEAKLKGPLGEATIIMCIDQNINIYQIIVIDNGRGLPLGKLLKSFTVKDVSGKIDSKAYRFNSGLYGVGAKVVGALSNHFRAITVRPDGVGSIYFDHQKIPKKPTIVKDRSKHTGTYVVFEPDDTIFTGIVEYMNGMYDTTTVEKLRLLSIFNDHQIKFLIHNQPLPKKFWKEKIPDAIKTINHIYQNSAVFYDNTLHKVSVPEFVRNYFGIERNWSWSCQLELLDDGESTMAYTLYIFTCKGNTIFGHLSMVNDTVMKDNDCSHIEATQLIIKRHLAPVIKDDGVRDFFLNTYIIPFYMCMDVKYEGAEFISLHKTGFKDSKFRALYSEDLKLQITSRVVQQSLKNLFGHIEKDLMQKYKAYKSIKIKSKDTKRLVLDLNHPTKFHDCQVRGSEAELFLVEGDSAGSTEGSANNQAIYMLRGKVPNAVLRPDRRSKSIASMIQSDIMSDIMKIIGLTSETKDFTTLRYGKIFIMVDADSNGKHIATILVGNFFVLNPEFVASGMLNVIIPPMYKIFQNKGSLFIQSANDLITLFSRNYFYQIFKIEIVSEGGKVFRLKEDEFVDLCKIVMYIGDAITRLSRKHGLDPLLLEQLTMVSHYLTPETMDVDAVKDILGYDTITYNEKDNILFLNIGHQDIYISLYDISKSLYHEILPALNKISWKRFVMKLYSTKADIYNGDVVSFVQLYKIFESAMSIFEYKYLKGLGGMSGTEKAQTCMNPKNRKSYRITSVGNVDDIYAMCGSDSRHRKTLLEFGKESETNGIQY